MRTVRGRAPSAVFYVWRMEVRPRNGVRLARLATLLLPFVLALMSVGCAAPAPCLQYAPKNVERELWVHGEAFLRYSETIMVCRVRAKEP